MSAPNINLHWENLSKNFYQLSFDYWFTKFAPCWESARILLFFQISRFWVFAQKLVDQHKKCSIAQLESNQTSVIHRGKKSRMSPKEDKSSGQQHKMIVGMVLYIFHGVCAYFCFFLSVFSVRTLEKWAELRLRINSYVFYFIHFGI